VTYAANPENDRLGETDAESDRIDQCDDHSYPLVVKLGRVLISLDNKHLVELSASLDGILFNIKGHNVGNRLRQISWPIDDSVAYIALPDSRGRVHSIDQLFGDNTLGPDGRFGRDGYHATLYRSTMTTAMSLSMRATVCFRR
jgi:hypothetical protein